MVKITAQWSELYNLRWDRNKTRTKDMSSILKFAEFVNENLNEASYSMNIGNAKEDKIAREYGASQIAQMDTDDEKYQELGLKFKYIIDGESLARHSSNRRFLVLNVVRESPFLCRS